MLVIVGGNRFTTRRQISNSTKTDVQDEAAGSSQSIPDETSELWSLVERLDIGCTIVTVPSKDSRVAHTLRDSGSPEF